MAETKVADWIQLVTGLAVVIGIGLVIWELKQAQQIAEAQIAFDSYALAVEINDAIFGENAADVLAKACEAPTSLTSGEWVILDSYYRNRISIGASPKLILELADLSGQTAEVFELLQTGVLSEIFSTAPGRAWFVAKYREREGETAKEGEALLKSIGPVSYKPKYELYNTETERFLNQP